MKIADIPSVRGPDYIVEIGGEVRPGPARLDQRRSHTMRAWLAVNWRCCTVYSRIYKNREGTAYEGGCPRCGSSVHVAISADGTDRRFFEAY